MGPGRYSATTAVMSSMDCGRRPVTTFVMPADSSWNTPMVLPWPSMWKVASSWSDTCSMEKSGVWRRIIFSASAMTVRLRRPKKSIFKRPSSSSVVMVYWVTICSSFLASGT